MDRYDRNRLLEFIGEDGQEKIFNAKVLILGVGGVGSNVLMNLAAVGVGHIGIVDNDSISITDLNRQMLYDVNSIGQYKVDVAKKWVKNFNPDIDIKSYCLRLDETNYREIYKDYDILVDAFDCAISVDLINETSVKMNKTLIHAAISNTQGTVMTTIPYKTPCFRCFMKSNSEAVENAPQNTSGAMAPTVNMIAVIQVFEVLKIILEKGNLLTTRPLIIDGFLGAAIRPKIYTSKREKCPVCGLPLHSFKRF